MPRRPRVNYSEAQIRGLKVVAKILKVARTEQMRNYPMREWCEFLEQSADEKRFTRTDVKFTHSDVFRYERAGTPVDKRNSTPTSISPTYLDVVSKYTPYPHDFLKTVLDGAYTDINLKPKTLSELIEQRQQEIGEFKFEQEKKKLNVTDEISERIKTGLIHQGDVAILCALLDIPVTKIQEGAISQIAQYVK